MIKDKDLNKNNNNNKEIKVIKKRGKYKKLNKINKELVSVKTIDLLVKGLTIPKIAMKLKVPRTTLYELISNNELWDEYKKNKKSVLDAGFSELAQRSVQEALKRLPEAKFKDLVISGAIAHDKIYPPATIAQQFNVMGKDLKVEMPQFFRPRAPHSVKDDDIEAN